MHTAMPKASETTILTERRPSIPFEAIGPASSRGNPTKGEGCPCCGATMNVKKPRVDLNTKTLLFGNSTVALELKEALLAEALARRAPEMVTVDNLLMAMYAPPADEPETSEVALRVVLHRLRPKAALLGVKIVNVHSVGYRMVLT